MASKDEEELQGVMSSDDEPVAAKTNDGGSDQKNVDSEDEPLICGISKDASMPGEPDNQVAVKGKSATSSSRRRPGRRKEQKQILQTSTNGTPKSSGPRSIGRAPKRKRVPFRSRISRRIRGPGTAQAPFETAAFSNRGARKKAKGPRATSAGTVGDSRKPARETEELNLLEGENTPLPNSVVSDNIEDKKHQLHLPNGPAARAGTMTFQSNAYKNGTPEDKYVGDMKGTLEIADRHGKILSDVIDAASSPHEEFQVERILASRTGVNGRTEYLINWHGYGEESNSWEPEENISVDLIDEYKRTGNYSSHMMNGHVEEDEGNGMLHSESSLHPVANEYYDSSAYSSTSSHLLNKAKSYFLGLGGILTKLAEVKDGKESEVTIRTLSKENQELREEYYEKEKELEQAQREILELQARLDKCTKDSKQKQLVAGRYELILKRQLVDKIKYLQHRVSESLARISELEAKIKALSSVWSDRVKEGQLKMRIEVEKAKEQLNRRNEEIKNVKMELRKSRVIAKAFKTVMETENSKLKAEVATLRERLKANDSTKKEKGGGKTGEKK